MLKHKGRFVKRKSSQIFQRHPDYLLYLQTNYKSLNSLKTIGVFILLCPSFEALKKAERNGK
jgi:hypothetical protein